MDEMTFTFDDNIDYGMDEKTEVELYSLAKLMREHLSMDQISEMFLPTLLKDEAYIRGKYPTDHPSVIALDEYHERVKLGLREPFSR
jgi:hypothetical protein